MEMDLRIKTNKIQLPSYRALRMDLHCWNRNKSFERAQNLIVSGVVWNLIGLRVVVIER
jgi:hypothetical protein